MKREQAERHLRAGVNLTPKQTVWEVARLMYFLTSLAAHTHTHTHIYTLIHSLTFSLSLATDLILRVGCKSRSDLYNTQVHCNVHTFIRERCTLYKSVQRERERVNIYNSVQIHAVR